MEDLSKFSFANFQPTKSSVHFLAKLGYWQFFLLVPPLAKTSPKYLPLHTQMVARSHPAGGLIWIPANSVHGHHPRFSQVPAVPIPGTLSWSPGEFGLDARCSFQLANTTL
jgi:hypothetical protein